jgi:predicted phage terminase large subunit-like protein
VQSTYHINPLRDIDLRAERQKIYAEQMRRNFSYFAREAWPHFDPAKLKWNWHLDAISAHLQAVSERRIQKLLINVPPGSAKSRFTCVLYPAWVWTKDPSWSTIMATYAVSLIQDHMLDLRRLLSCDWYRTTFNIKWQFQEDQNKALDFKNTALGRIMGIGVGGKGTGYRAKNIIVDDSLKAQDATSDTAKKEVQQWWTGTMKSRTNDPKNDTFIGISQRLAEDDWSGYRLAEGGWTHLRIPMEYELHPNCTCKNCISGVTAIGWSDPRQTEGELMFPDHWGVKQLADYKLDPISYAAQYQQDPLANTAGLVDFACFNKVWVRPGEPHMPIATTAKELDNIWDVQLIEQPPNENAMFWTWDRQIMVVDCTFADTKKSDKVAIGVFGKRGSNVYLIDLWWQQASFTQTTAAIKDLAARYPLVGGKYIEKAANGPAVTNYLQDEVSGLVLVQAKGSKESRFQAVVPFIQAKNLILPLHAPWRIKFIQELVGFPRAKNDDAVDITAYGLSELLIGRRTKSVIDSLTAIPFDNYS